MEGILLDFPRTMETAILDEIGVSLTDITHWRRPTPSPRDTNDRKLIIGYTDNTCRGIADAIAVRTLRRRLQHVPLVAVGHSSILSDACVLIADLQGPGGLLAQADMLDQVIFLSAKRAVLITTDAWEQKLTQQAVAEDRDRMMRLSWRKSTRGGRISAAPQTLTVGQAADMTDVWSPSLVGPGRATILVQCTGDIPSDPTAIGMLLISSKLEAKTAWNWALLPLGSDPAPPHLAPVRCRGGEWDGSYAVEAANPKMTSDVASALNHLCLEG
jgi:hypothetical protein